MKQWRIRMVWGTLVNLGGLVLTSTLVWASYQSLALGKDLTFSVETDKPVYNYSEQVRITVTWTNPTDADWNIVSPCGPPFCEAHVNVIDVTTGPPPGLPSVYATPSTFLPQVSVGHSTATLAIAEIPAYTLKSGNRKYWILVTLALKLKQNSDQITIYQVNTNPSQVFTVR